VWGSNRPIRDARLNAVFSIVKPQSADWLDGWVNSRPAAGSVGWAAGQAAGLLVSLPRMAGVLHTKKLVRAFAMLESA
jgi:hypothetical protein